MSAAAGGGVDVLAVLRRHAALAEEVACPEQIAEAHAVFNAVAELIAAVRGYRSARHDYDTLGPGHARQQAAVVLDAADDRLDAALSNIEGGKQ